VLGLAVLVALLAHPLAGAASDVWGNVGPSPQIGGGIAGRYPLTNYSLDQHFDAVSASLTGGVDVSGVPPMIAYFLASILWIATSFLANLLITLFSFAFSLDLVNGSEATGGAGALAPVARAIHSIYAGVLGEPWLVLAVAIAGIWAMWKALMQRRYTETAGALGLSLIYVVAALFFVAQPGSTIGSVSKWTNEMSGAFLSISSNGNASSTRQAKEDTANELFDLLVFKPWVVLNFGGLEHCVRAGTGDGDTDPESVAVRPLSSSPDRDAALARRLQTGNEITADGKVCVNNANKYAPRFLRYGMGDDARNDEYDALDHGDSSDLADADRSGYWLGVADKPATDAMEEGGQYQRLLLALILFVGELGAFLLLGALSIGVILAQVLLLLLLAFSPVALIAAVIPGRGHDFFKGWLEKLVGYLLRKAAYSLILAVLLAVTGALSSAAEELGWLMSFGLQSFFFWAVFLQRKTLADSLIGIATGPQAPGREASLRLLSVYAGARIAGRFSRPLRRDAGSAARTPGRLAGAVRSRMGNDDPHGPPFLETSYSRPVGGGAPPIDSADPAAARPDTSSASPGSPPDRKSQTAAPADRVSAPANPAAASAPGRGSRAKDKANEKRSSRGPAAADPVRDRSAGDGDLQQRTGRTPKRDSGRPAGTAASPQAHPPSRKGDGDLSAELRAERERTVEEPKSRDARSRRDQRPPAAKPAHDHRREPQPPRRKRKSRRRKDGER
jgi:hypothetical protein